MLGMEKILVEDFSKINILVGTILDAKLNSKAKKTAYILRIDFGSYGIKKSSAQITKNYSIKSLIGMQIIAVVNLPIKIVAGIESEVLVLGVHSLDKDVVLLTPSESIENGLMVT